MKNCFILYEFPLDKAPEIYDLRQLLNMFDDASKAIAVGVTGRIRYLTGFCDATVMQSFNRATPDLMRYIENKKTAVGMRTLTRLEDRSTRIRGKILGWMAGQGCTGYIISGSVKYERID